MRVEVRVSGVVQGVGFRPFVYRVAMERGIKGYVRNLGDACVEIIAQGRRGEIDAFINDLQERKPSLARIFEVKVKSLKGDEALRGFRILGSGEEGWSRGSIIPPDISICNDCLGELRDPLDRRYNYFFITCTNCGPRYTTIEKLPYDRSNTAMRAFPMCVDCRREYTKPGNRRFHAQTIACPKCGPKAYLVTGANEPYPSRDPIREAGELLEEGWIVAVKGNGGFHIATATTLSKPIARLRREKHRSQKPFAVIARDLYAIRSFAEVGALEEELLVSYMKPILLLKKRDDYYLSEAISPGLHNIGVMLPYTGLHVMLFNKVEEPAFVMTSANPPSQPIITENDEAIKKLSGIVDYFLLHDRDIAQRCDDSVVRVINGAQSLIRRSRGYAPTPIALKGSLGKCVLGLGAQENVSSCIIVGERAFISQYIGDIETLETLNYLRESINHLIALTNSEIEVVSHDVTGFRKVRAGKGQLLINGEPVLLRGYNRHEDHPTFGCSLPVELMMYDLQLLRDLGCNFVRTSHYPNDMRFLDLCDEMGFYVWEESHYRNVPLDHPKFREQTEAVTVEMIEWHHNRPSIITWGCLNEADNTSPFGQKQHAWLLRLMRDLDGSRPVTYASNRGKDDKCMRHADIVSWNRYDAWYGGEPRDIEPRLKDMLKWLHSDASRGGRGKPVIMSEFGGGAIYGWRHPHRAKWTEQYQRDLLDESLRVYLNRPEVVGVAIWQFCDCRITPGKERAFWPSRPRSMNNKGTVDEYRRAKLAYQTVRKRMREATRRWEKAIGKTRS